MFVTMKVRSFLSRERVGIQAERQVLSHAFECEERQRLCTKELVMLEVAMASHGNRLRTSDNSRQE